MYAAQNGQLEAVKLMLDAKADPHMKAKVSNGKDPKEGETAKDIATKMGYDDVVGILQKAEKDIPPGRYKRYGKDDHNMRLTVYQTGETGSGKSPFEAVRDANYVPGKKKELGPPRTK